MTSHYVQWDYLRPGRTSFAICGALVPPSALSNDPSCPVCQQELAKTVEDVFGPEPSRVEKLAGVKPVALKVVHSANKKRGAA